MAKRNGYNGNLRWIIGLAALIGTLLSVGGWVNGTRSDINTLQDCQEKIKPMVYENSTDVKLLKKDISYIVAGIDEIKKSVKK